MSLIFPKENEKAVNNEGKNIFLSSFNIDIFSCTIKTSTGSLSKSAI